MDRSLDEIVAESQVRTGPGFSSTGLPVYRDEMLVLISQCRHKNAATVLDAAAEAAEAAAAAAIMVAAVAALVVDNPGNANPILAMA